MRILILSGQLPYPLKSGEHVRVFNLLKGLSRRNRVSLLSLVTSDDVRFVRFLEKYCERVETVQAEYNLDLGDKLRSLLKPSNFPRTGRRLLMLLAGAPLRVSRGYFPEFERKLREMLKNESYDVIQVECSYMAQYIQRNRLRADRAYIVLDQLEVASCTMERYFHVSGGLKRLFYYLEHRRMRRYEKRIWPLFDGIYAMSLPDRDKMLSVDPQLNIAVIPNGVDTAYFSPRGGLAKSRDILFVGYFIHSPNVDGLSFFCREVLPLIKERVPEARLIVVGGGATREVEALGQRQDVIFKGYVEDIRPIMDACRLMVVPLRVGGGTRLKILEALSQGLPVVSTAVGCEGIDVRDGSEASIADGPEAFAEQVVKLLHDDALCQRMRENGRKLATERYSWGSIVETLEGVLPGGGEASLSA